MWVCFNDAFVSAVADPKQPGMLKVRARKKRHLQTLFPKAKIVSTARTDYAHRVFVTKTEFAKLLAERVLAIDYDNFKNSVRDRKLHDLYADFWELHYGYQG